MEMLVTRREFTIRDSPNQGMLVTKMSRKERNLNLGRLGKKEGKMRITGPSLAVEAQPPLLPFHAWCQ